MIVTSSFMKFYTDMVGLSPAIYGVVFLIFSIWNGINDPIIGYWADKRPFLTGRGKYRSPDPLVDPDHRVFGHRPYCSPPRVGMRS